MAEDAAGDRSERATPKRREEARDRGQVPRSQEVNSTLVALGGGLVVLACAADLGRGVADVGRRYFTGMASISLETPAEGTAVVRMLGQDLAMLLWPVLTMLVVISIGVAASQVGWHFSTQALAFRFERLNLIDGLKKFVNAHVWFELAKNLAKAGLATWIAASTIEAALPRVLDLAAMPEAPAWMEVTRLTRTLMLRMLAALAVLAIADLLWQRKRHEDSLKMSRAEVKEELKDSEGDPQVKARLRAIQLDIARRRMMADVQRADVVVVNPTHLAVALAYDRSEPAPRVVAKGRGFLATRIVEVARDNKVPVVRDVPLARALFKACRIGDFVPIKLYQAAAQVLAAVFRASARAGRKSSPSTASRTGGRGLRRRAARQG